MNRAFHTGAIGRIGVNVPIKIRDPVPKGHIIFFNTQHIAYERASRIIGAQSRTHLVGSFLGKYPLTLKVFVDGRIYYVAKINPRLPQPICYFRRE